VTAIFLWGVKFFGTMKYASIGADFSVFTSICFYFIAGGLLHLCEASQRRRALIVFLVGCNLLAYSSILRSAGGHRLTVTFLDVGQGDGAVVEFPDGKIMIVDAGQRMEGYDVGSRVVIPYLRWKGIRRVDYLVVTHPHSDHLGGVPVILREVPVDEIIDAGSTASSYLCGEFRHILDSLGERRDIVHAGNCIDENQSVRCYVLHPSGEFLPSSLHPARNLNNESVVLKIVFGSTTLLLEGDAERDAEARMVRFYGGFLRSDLLKVGHHGSPTSSSVPMMDRVQPRMAVISVGAHNKFGHPSPRTLALLDRMKCMYYRTDHEGAVMFESDGISWQRKEWRTP
jgi:competence protein ComEC